MLLCFSLLLLNAEVNGENFPNLVRRRRLFLAVYVVICVALASVLAFFYDEGQVTKETDFRFNKLKLVSEIQKFASSKSENKNKKLF